MVGRVLRATMVLLVTVLDAIPTTPSLSRATRLPLPAERGVPGPVSDEDGPAVSCGVSDRPGRIEVTSEASLTFRLSPLKLRKLAGTVATGTASLPECASNAGD